MPQTRDGVLNDMAIRLAREIKEKGGQDTERIIEIIGDVANANFVETFEKELRKNSDSENNN